MTATRTQLNAAKVEYKGWLARNAERDEWWQARLKKMEDALKSRSKKSKKSKES